MSIQKLREKRKKKEKERVQMIINQYSHDTCLT